jgi:periplasmic protein TonB
MPRDLFGVDATPTALKRPFSKWTVLGSALLHVAMLAIVLIVPLLADDVLPRPNIERVQYVAASALPATPPASTPEPPRIDRPVPNPNAAPVVAPDTIRDEDPTPPAPVNTGFELGERAASGDPTIGIGLGDTLGTAPPAPPVQPAPRTAPSGPMRLSSGIRPPVRTHFVAPVYPQIAQMARVEGRVDIDAIIGTDGVVQQVRVLSGNPLLDDAALNAVRQWRYTSATLNNQPVAVIMTVTVTFTLQH